MAATLELTHKGNINDKTILERDREVKELNVTLLASAIARLRHLVIDTRRTDLGVTRQRCHQTGQASWGWALRNSCRKKPAKRPVGNELQTFAEKVPTENQEGSS